MGLWKRKNIGNIYSGQSMEDLKATIKSLAIHFSSLNLILMSHRIWNLNCNLDPIYFGSISIKILYLIESAWTYHFGHLNVLCGILLFSGKNYIKQSLHFEICTRRLLSCFPASSLYFNHVLFAGASFLYPDTLCVSFDQICW